MKHFFITLFIIILMISCASKNQVRTPKQKKANIYFTNGTKHLIKHNYRQAISNLKTSIKLDPKNEDTLVNLGLAYLLQGYLEKGIYHLNQALSLNPKNIDAQVNLAGAYFKKKRFKQARQIYLRISKVIDYSQQYRTYYNLALIEKRFNRSRSMVKYLKISIKENDQYCPSHYLLSTHYIKKYQYQSALDEALASSRGRCYKKVEPILLQARVYKLLNKNKSAYSKYRSVIKRFPNSKYSTIARNYLNDLLQKNPRLAEKTMDTNRKDILKRISL